MIVPTEKLSSLNNQGNFENNKGFFVDEIEKLAAIWIEKWESKINHEVDSDFDSDSENVEYIFEKDTKNLQKMKFLKKYQYT